MFGNVTSVRHSSIIHKLLIFFEISFSEEDLRVIAGMLKLKLKQLEITGSLSWVGSQFKQKCK